MLQSPDKYAQRLNIKHSDNKANISWRRINLECVCVPNFAVDIITEPRKREFTHSFLMRRTTLKPIQPIADLHVPVLDKAHCSERWQEMLVRDRSAALCPPRTSSSTQGLKVVAEKQRAPKTKQTHMHTHTHTHSLSLLLVCANKNRQNMQQFTKSRCVETFVLPHPKCRR